MKLYFEANIKLTNGNKIRRTYETIKIPVNANELEKMAKKVINLIRWKEAVVKMANKLSDQD
jgi:hypothetical protein